MSHIIFGILFTLPSLAIGSVILYVTHANGIGLSELGPAAAFLLFFGFAAVIGLGITIKGIIDVIQDRAILKKGFETYGIIAQIHQERRVHSKGQRRLYLHGDIRVLGEDGQIYKYIKNLGYDRSEYDAGDFVRVDHYKNDITILGYVPPELVPPNIKKKLNLD